MLTLLANGLWALLNVPDALAFECATRRVEATQRGLLMQLLRRNAGTDFGQRHRFAELLAASDPARAYQASVPRSTYTDYSKAIEQIGQGAANVLTRDAVRLLEPTSGSSAATKLIPYTASLQQEFQRAIAPWIVRTFLRHPRVLGGAAYWSVSPATRHPGWPDGRTAGGLPVGFDDDSAYLGGAAAWLVNRVLAVPTAVKAISDIATFRYVTLLFLLHRRDLALVSVWNPTFWTLLVEPLAEWWPALVDDLARGTITPEAVNLPPLPTRVQQHLQQSLRPAPRRSQQIRKVCARPTAFANDPSRAETYRQLWPSLRLISCWTDANAQREAERLARLFPHALIQPKGLIATEGIVSLPLAGNYPGAALALRSHFFEFMSVDSADGVDTDDIKLAHELEIGARYGVLLTTGGGLYRYDLGDVVRVVGHYRRCPLLRFEGKRAHVSDWFGEKLHEQHVRTALDALLVEQRVTVDFAMVACEVAASPSAYTLFIQTRAGDAQLIELGRALEQRLCKNFHYAYCRRLGQLAALRVFRIARGGQASYLAGCIRRGQRAGDVKPTALHRGEGWSAEFEGEWVLS